MNNKILSRDEIITIRNTHKIVNKLRNRINKLINIRKECDKIFPTKRTKTNGEKWKKASLELYEILDVADKYKIIDLIGDIYLP